MAITISGINNNDRIVATDGTIDALSGFNVVGVMTAASFSGDLVGNVTGNVTGNINNSTLLLQTSGSERIRLTGNTEIGIAGANYGTAGQVLTSGGSGNAVSWTTISGGVTSDSEENTVGGTNAGNALDSDTYRNTLFGYDTGKLINSGDDNTIIGWKAGDAITDGYKNCAVGSEALPNCNSGHNNVAMGWEAGRSVNSGNNNVLLGPMAGRSIGGGTYNIALGYHSLSNVGSPTRCIGIGGDSVFLGGTDVIGMGQGTMMKGNSQIGGIGIGRYAGRNNAGDYNVYVGYEAGYGTGSSPYAIGNYNIGLGYKSLYNITSASSNVAIGASAGDVLTTGGNNIILGDGADASSATISNEVTIGNSSINHVRVPGIGVSFSAGGAVISGIVTATNFVKADGSTVGFSPDAQNNLFAGTDAGASLNSNSSDNILLGQDAGDSITEGEYNVCIGLRAGQALTDVDKNVCIGNDAGRNNNSSSNVFVGWYAGAGAGSNGNVCIGHMAGSEANGNETAYGYSSGPTASYSGNTNVCMGFASGNGLRSSASRNTILGPGAGRNDSVGQVNINGSDNIILGSYSSLSSVSASNECVIGAVYGSSKAINHLRVPGIGVSFSAGGAVISGIVTATGIDLSGEVAASQDYPNFRPSLDLNFAATKKLDSRITYTRSGYASFTNERGLLEIVNANVPRFDHDPVTRECKGLLIEEGRTNLLTYSHIAGMSSPNLGGSPQTNDTVSNITLPTGEKGDVRRYLANASGGGGRWGDYSGTNNQKYTGSVWVRTVSGTGTAILDINDGGGKTINLTTEWQRVTTTHSTNNTYRFFDIYFASPVTIYYWGVQIEEGEFMSSYIPTYNATGVRGADTCYIDGQDFDDFYNQPEGTIVSSHSLLENVSTTSNCYTYQVAPDSGTTEAPFRLIDRNSAYGNTLVATSINSNASVCFFKASGDPATVANVKMKVAFAIKKDDFAASFNGGATLTDTAGNVAETNDHIAIGYYKPSPQAYLNGHIQRLAYYPKRLPNNQLRNLSS